MKSNEDDFFSRVCIRSGINDITLIKKIYFSIIKEIIMTLRDKSEQALPDFGTFVTMLLAGRRIKNVGTGQYMNSKTQNVVKFIPNRQLKEYFRLL